MATFSTKLGKISNNNLTKKELYKDYPKSEWIIITFKGNVYIKPRYTIV